MTRVISEPNEFEEKEEAKRRAKYLFWYVKKRRKGIYSNYKNYSTAEILPIIKQNVDEESTLYTDGFKTYDGLADFGYEKHYRIKHSDSDTK